MTMLPYDSRVLLQQEYLRGLSRQESPNRASQTASALVTLQLQQQLNDARLRLLQNGASLFPASTPSIGLAPSAADHDRALLSQAIQRAMQPASNQLQLGFLEAMNFRQQEQSRLQGLAAALTSFPTTQSFPQSVSIHSVSSNSSRELAADVERASLPATQSVSVQSVSTNSSRELAEEVQRVSLPATQTLRPLEQLPSDANTAKDPVAAPSTTPRKRSHANISPVGKMKAPNALSTKGAMTPSGVSSKGDGLSQASPFFAMSPLPGSAAYPAYRAYQKKKGILLNRNGKKSLKWYAMLEQLKQYKEEHGDCIVPRGFAPNTKLASWVAEQRKQYKLFKDGKRNSITQDRIDILDKLDFAWNAQEAAWARHFEDLKNFREENGHCHVPLNHHQYPKLGLWVKEARRHHTLLKQGKKSHMTEERIKKLDSIGFCWDTHETTWLDRLSELVAYKEKYGSCNVPVNFKENPRLSTWVHHQRRQHKKFREGKRSHITKERIRALDKIGFYWTIRGDFSMGSNSSDTEPDTEPESEDESYSKRPQKRQRKLTSDI